MSIKTAQSDVHPEFVWVRPLNDGSGKAIVTLRRNVQGVEVPPTEEGGASTQFEYEETDIVLIDRPNIEDYAAKNIDALFSLAEQQEREASIPSQVETLTQIVTSLMFEIDALKAEKEAE